MSGEFPAHAHQAIQICFLFDGRIRLRAQDDDPWRDFELDAARFKYPPHWMPVELLFAAMQEQDPDTGRTRGWLLLRKRSDDE